MCKPGERVLGFILGPWGSTPFFRGGGLDFADLQLVEVEPDLVEVPGVEFEVDFVELCS